MAKRHVISATCKPSEIIEILFLCLVFPPSQRPILPLQASRESPMMASNLKKKKKGQRHYSLNFSCKCSAIILNFLYAKKNINGSELWSASCGSNSNQASVSIIKLARKILSDPVGLKYWTGFCFISHYTNLLWSEDCLNILSESFFFHIHNLTIFSHHQLS